MNENLTWTSFALFTIGIILLFLWLDRCKKCGSWNTRTDIRVSHDDHQPALEFTTGYRCCKACGERKMAFHEVKRRPQHTPGLPRSPWSA